MPKTAKITVEVSKGPALRAALDVLELADDLIELIPSWQRADIEELRSRILGLQEVCLTRLKARADGGD